MRKQVVMVVIDPLEASLSVLITWLIINARIIVKVMENNARGMNLLFEHNKSSLIIDVRATDHDVI